MIDFLALGESLIDLISSKYIESLSKANHFDVFVGGQPTNLAINMAKLGYRSALATCLGSDGLGRKALSYFQASGVITDYVQVTEQSPTSLAMITRKTTGTPEFIIYRGADGLLKSNPAIKNIAKDIRIIHTSAFALSRDPTRETILDIIKFAKNQKHLITFDPNYHPHIWPDKKDFIETIKDVLPYIDITKPSIEDSERLFGSGLTPIEYLEKFLAWGVKTVILTMGKSGVYVSTNDGCSFEIQPNDINPSDVTGAGDAFWSGLLSGLLEDKTLQDAACMGQVMAEYKLHKFGPITTFPDKEQLFLNAQQIQYKTLRLKPSQTKKRR